MKFLSTIFTLFPPLPHLTNSMLRRNVAFWCTNHLNLIYISSFCQRRSRFLAPFPPLQFNVEKKFRRRTGDCAGSPSLARGDSRGKDATPRDFRPQRSPTLNSKGGKGGGRQENPSTLRVGGGGHDEGYEVFWRIRVAGKRTDPLWARSLVLKQISCILRRKSGIWGNRKMFNIEIEQTTLKRWEERYKETWSEYNKNA